jgi:hypothetical protein
MLKSIEQLKILEERNLVNEEEIIRLRGGIQRNNISANLTIGLIIKLSDEIENLKNEISELNAKFKTADLLNDINHDLDKKSKNKPNEIKPELKNKSKEQ